MRSVIASLIVMLLRGYRCFLSPLKGALFGPGTCCRHEPSCSVYAETAVLRHGIFRGLFLALRRLLRCHPWGGSGYDPVPAEWPSTAWTRAGVRPVHGVQPAGDRS